MKERTAVSKMILKLKLVIECFGFPHCYEPVSLLALKFKIVGGSSAGRFQSAQFLGRNKIQTIKANKQSLVTLHEQKLVVGDAVVCHFHTATNP